MTMKTQPTQRLKVHRAFKKSNLHPELKQNQTRLKVHRLILKVVQHPLYLHHLQSNQVFKPSLQISCYLPSVKLHYIFSSDSKPKLNFYDDTVYDNDNEPVIDTSAINSPKYVYAPRIDTSHEYNGPYDLNLYRVRDTLVKSLGGGFYPRFSRANKNKYDQYFYLMEKLKYKLGIKRLVSTRFEQRLWQEIKEETFDVSQRIHKNYIFVNSRIEDYKY